MIAPQFGPRLVWVTARYDSPRGLVQVRWRRQREGVDIEADIPPGRPAELRIPASTAGDITVDGLPVGEHRWAGLLGGRSTHAPAFPFPPGPGLCGARLVRCMAATAGGSCTLARGC